MMKIPFEEARNREKLGETPFCGRCGKKTSTYSRKVPATGLEQKYGCMCCSPIYKFRSVLGDKK